MPSLDARRHPGGRIESDICIVGAGAAGIAMALELAGTNLSVTLVESGDTPFRHRPQLLYRGENIGLPNFSVAKSRLRRLGGSTTRWAGQCRPLDPLDFEERDWIDHSGWPFSRVELDPYYARAHKTVSLGPYRYDLDLLRNGSRAELPVDPQQIETIVYQFSRRKNFANAYGDALERAGNLALWRNANAVEIVTNASGKKIDAIHVRTFNGRRFEFSARSYVLALGGIENARLMLASNRIESGGVGNRHDLVGRFFADHPYFTMGYFDPQEPEYDRNWYTIEDYERQPLEIGGHAGFRLPDAVQREERLNGAAVYLIRRPSFKIGPQYFSRPARSANFLIDILRHYDLPDGRLAHHASTALKGLPQLAGNLIRSARHLMRPNNKLSLRAIIETSPDPDSRVMLGATKDAFGMPRVRVDWRVREDDKRGLHRLIERLCVSLPGSGAGSLVLDESQLDNGWPASMVGGKHHIGTTRMHRDPRQGVVDPDCRVHGIGNLYIAGSSVFPTAGYVNPTLTIVALAIRLADHLKAQKR